MIDLIGKIILRVLFSVVLSFIFSLDVKDDQGQVHHMLFSTAPLNGLEYFNNVSMDGGTSYVADGALMAWDLTGPNSFKLAAWLRFPGTGYTYYSMHT